MRVERDEKDGHLILRFEFPEDRVWAEQIIQAEQGRYTTWIHFQDDPIAEEAMQQIKTELMETLITRLRTESE